MRILKPKMMEEASGARIPKNVILQVLIFIAVFIVIELAMMAAAIIIMMPDLISAAGVPNAALTETINGVMASEKAVIVSLYATLIMTVLSIVHCKFIEKRSLASIGFRKRKAARNYFVGLGVGLALFAAVYFICAAFGAVEISSVSFNINYGMFFIFFFGFVLQGMSEEVLLRGYLMNSIGAKRSLYVAIAISSVAFSIMHGFNAGIGVVGFINLTLYGVLMAVYMIYFDDIWGACGIHTMWNFAQGNVFGILVSGMKFGDSIIESRIAADMSLINGGDFGMEGGLITTAVLCAVIFIILICINKKQNSVSAATQGDMG